MITVVHGLSEDEVRRRVEKAFEDFAAQGAEVRLSLDPTRNEGAFAGSFSHWLAGKITLTDGRLIWDSRMVHVQVTASAHQAKVDEKIREFMAEALD